jgi:EmrB/QacA subfamily drug resistance transporter
MAKSRRNEWAVLLTLSLGFFMTLLDLTIVNIAIPDMRRGLHASLAEIGWVINAYIIVLAVLMITAGRLGDLRGRKNLFLIGVAVFTLASAASGLSQNGTELIAARAVQGLGAALLLPQTMAIIIAIFPGDQRGKALGVWGAVAGLATISGPTVGGMLVTWLGWRWIFFVNVPVGVIALLLALVILPDVRGGHRQRLDFGGVLIASVALVAITFGLVEGQAYRWGVVWRFISIPLIIGFGLELMALFLFVQGRRQDRQPLLPFSLFHDRNYALMSVANVIVSVGLVGMALPLTIFLQSVLGFSPIKAGLTMAPSALVSGVTAPFAGRLADRGGKYLLMCGFLLYAAGLAIIVAAARNAMHWYDLTPGYLVTGLGIGCTISPMQTIATRNVDPRLAGAASGVMNTFRQTGSALGSAVVLAVLQNRLAGGVGYITSMRFAIAVPGVSLVVAGLLCLGIQRLKPAPAKPLWTPVPDTSPPYLPRVAEPAEDSWASVYPEAWTLPPADLPPSATLPRVTPTPPSGPRVPEPRPSGPASGPRTPGLHAPRPPVPEPVRPGPRTPGPVQALSAPVPGPAGSRVPGRRVPEPRAPEPAGPPRPPGPSEPSGPSRPAPARAWAPAAPMLAAPVFADESLHVVEMPRVARHGRPKAPPYVEEPRPGDPLPDGPLYPEDLPPDES